MVQWNEMKRMSDFTQEEYDAISVDDYEDFYMDTREVPEVIEAQERYSKKESSEIKILLNGKQIGWKEIQKYWILTHPNIKKRQNPQMV